MALGMLLPFVFFFAFAGPQAIRQKRSEKAA